MAQGEEPYLPLAGGDRRVASGGGSPSRRLVEHQHSNFRDVLSASSLLSAFLVTAASAIGSGLLALPWAVGESGLALGIIELCFGAMMCFMTLAIVALSSQRLGTTSYTASIEKALGRRAGCAADAVLFAETFIGLAVFFIFLVEFLRELLDLLPKQPNWTTVPSLTIITAVLVAPLCIPRELSVLRFASIISLVALTYTSLAIVIKTPSIIAQHDKEFWGTSSEAAADKADGIVYWPQDTTRALRAIAVSQFAYFCHFNITPAVQQMRNPSEKRTLLLCASIAGFLCFMFCPIAACGYLSWRGGLRKDLLSNYERRDFSIILARILLSLTMMVQVPLYVHPMMGSFEMLIRRMQSGNTQIQPQEAFADEAPLLAQGTPPSSTSEISQSGDDGASWRNQKYRSGVDRPLRDGQVKELEHTRTQESTGTAPSTKSSPELKPGVSDPLCGAGTPCDTQPDTRPAPFHLTFMQRTFFVLLFIVISVIIALAVPDAIGLVAVMGGVFDTLFVTIFPLWMYFKVLYQHYSILHTSVVSAALLVYTVLGVSSGWEVFVSSISGQPES